ncbi:hypothetical protein PP707_04715 [Acetobacter pasteurianus]|nr:hypothetical protein [Acetobacter pasteurianus]
MVQAAVLLEKERKRERKINGGKCKEERKKGGVKGIRAVKQGRFNWSSS